MDVIYSTESNTASTENTSDKAKEAIVKRTCNSCRQNPLMQGCTCVKEMFDLHTPHCLIVHQALKHA